MKQVLRIMMGCLVAAGPVLAQTAAKPLKFEVVSIKQNTGPPGIMNFGATPDGFHAIGIPLIAIFQMAYAPSAEAGFLRGDRISGAPDWMKGANGAYDVVAKVGDADLAEWQSSPQRQTAMLKEMLQTMLAERCKAVVHHDSKEVPVYDLVVAKGGPKFKAAETVDAAELKQKHAGGVMMPGSAGMIVPGPNGVQLYGVTMAMLGQSLLSGLAGRPVVDKTGLTGRYDILLGGLGPQPPPPPPAAATSGAPQMMVPPGPDDTASIFSELPERLGLRLEPAKDVVETLVIDHVERPTEN